VPQNNTARVFLCPLLGEASPRGLALQNFPNLVGRFCHRHYPYLGFAVPQTHTGTSLAFISSHSGQRQVSPAVFCIALFTFFSKRISQNKIPCTQASKNPKVFCAPYQG
jgi:hypothetical protein